MSTKQHNSRDSFIQKILDFLINILMTVFNFLLPSKLAVERIHLNFANLRHSLKFVHLSDFHYDQSPPWPQRILPKLLQDVIDVIKKFNPDFIVITGDFVQSRSFVIEEFATKWLRPLTNQFKVYAVLGNHDYKEGKKGMTHIIRALRNVGVNVLLNEKIQLSLSNNNQTSVELIGLGDWYSQTNLFIAQAFQGVTQLGAITEDDFKTCYREHPYILRGPSDNKKTLDIEFDSNSNRQNSNQLHSSEKEKSLQRRERPFRLVLSHNPDSCDVIKYFDVDMVVSGHTHGGQVCLPFSRKPLIPYIKAFYHHLPAFLKKLIPREISQHFNVVYHWEWVSGLHCIPRVDGGYMYLYTNRGLATHPPCRLFCSPEVTLFELEPQK
jgi:predicted MPP superfamily phosphohydrolase